MTEHTSSMVRQGDFRSGATSVPHGVIGAYDVDDALDAETVDAIAVGVVSHILRVWNHLDAWLRQIEALRRVA